MWVSIVRSIGVDGKMVCIFVGIDVGNLVGASTQVGMRVGVPVGKVMASR